jgi:23S rRNA pseudouridine2605 synthase
MPKLRLNKILAQAGVTSRRGGDRLIADGHVAVNGVVTRELATLADPAVDVVTVDGRPIPGAEAKQYVLLHKPRGYVTTRHDPEGRPIVTDLVARGARLYPVGRLDADVEGALLLTNDGDLTHRLLHPRYGLPRVYEADVAGRVGAADLARWRAGVELDDGFARPLDVALAGERRPASHGREETTRVRLTFAEGRKHEVKRYCQALGHPVVRLRRIAFGPVELGDLPVGASRELTRAELAALRRAVADAKPREKR